MRSTARSRARIAVWLGLPLLFLPTAEGQGEFDGRTDVVLVEVPVVVSTAQGEPLRGLGLDDFTLRDDGRRQTLAGFQVVDLERLDAAISARRPGEIPSAARRHFLLLFDLAFSSPAASLRAQETARRFVLETLAPSDLAAVVRFTLESGPQLLTGFTTDRAQLARALDTLGVAAPPRSEPHPETQESSDIERRRISAWSRSLGEMADRLGVLPGRKQVLYFSEGLDARWLVGRGAAADDLEQRREQRNLERGEIWRSDPEARLGSASLRAEVERMLDAFRRTGCTLYTLDIAGLRADRSANDVLHHLATSTGGVLIDGTNDLTQALAKTLDRSTVTYLLSFYPERPGRPGEQRRLEVEVRAPRGTHVEHRPSYTVPKSFAELHPFEKELLAAEAIIDPALRRELELAVLAVPFSTGGERAYVAVILELEGRELLTEPANKTLPIELYAWATDAEGHVRATFNQRLDLDLDQARERLAEGLAYYAHLELEPGDYVLRVLVREGISGRTSVENRKLRVPRPTEPWLSPPLVPPTTHPLRLREKTEPDERGKVTYPFLDAGKPFIPSARPKIVADEGVTFFLFCQNLPAGDLELKGSFKQGTETRALGLRLVEHRQGEPETLVIAIDTKGLGEGEGVLTVEIKGVATAIELEVGKR